jgi:Ca2+-binding EF-hand superfamily protein
MAIVTRLLAPAALLVALAMPAAAQQSEEGTPMTAAECRSLFQEADTNGDGVLSQQEMAAAVLEGFQAGIGLSAFLAECQG